MHEDISPSDVLDPLLLPMNSAVEGMPAVYVDDMSANFLRHGNPVQCSGAPATGLVQVYLGEDEMMKPASLSALVKWMMTA